MLNNLMILLTFLNILLFVNAQKSSPWRSFIFLSGWPQSGSSLMQQLLHMTSNVSTMIDNCDKLFKRCESLDYEGQWFLGGNSTLFRTINPGKFCPTKWEVSWLGNTPVTSYYEFDPKRNGAVASFSIRGTQKPASLPGDVTNNVLQAWDNMWKIDSEKATMKNGEEESPLVIRQSDIKDHYFVEKSPASMMKMFFMNSLVKPLAMKSKFLVMLKHPVALLGSTLRGYDWLFHLDLQRSRERHHHIEIVNTLEEKYANLNHFLNIMHPGLVESNDVDGAERNSSKVQNIYRSLVKIRNNLLYNNVTGAAAEKDVQILNTAVSEFVSEAPNVAATCDGKGLGWLDSMQYLYYELLLSKQYNVDVRIVRYEDFVQPRRLCYKLFKFIFDRSNEILNRENAFRVICEKKFVDTVKPNRVRIDRPSADMTVDSSIKENVFRNDDLMVSVTMKLMHFRTMIAQMHAHDSEDVSFKAWEVKSGRFEAYEDMLAYIDRRLGVYGYRLPLPAQEEGLVVVEAGSSDIAKNRLTKSDIMEFDLKRYTKLYNVFDGWDLMK